MRLIYNVPVRFPSLIGVGALGVLGACTSDKPASGDETDQAPSVSLAIPADAVRRYADVPFAVTATFSDDHDAPSALAVSWSTDIAGAVSVPGAPDSSGMWPAQLRLPEGQQTLTVAATDSAGNTGTGTLLLNVGGANVPPTCAITDPANGTTVPLDSTVRLRGEVDDRVQPAETLVVRWTSDLDGDLGTATPSSDGAVSLTGVVLSRGMHVLTLEATDELGATCTSDVTITVLSPPTLVLDAPADGARVNDDEVVELRGTATDEEDAEGDLLLSVESSEDGVVFEGAPSASGRFIEELAGLSTGTHLLTVTVTDTSGLSTSTSVEVEVNGLPGAPTVRIEPSPARTANDLRAVLETPSFDPERDAVTYTYRWYRDGVLSAASTSDVLPASATSRGEAWSVEVIPSDGLGTGAVGTAAITIANTPPALVSASLSPAAPVAGNTLSCAATGWSDNDSDRESVSYAWTVNGTAMGTTSSLATTLRGGDVVVCTVTPNDGFDAGTPVMASVTVANTAPVLASVVLSPSPAREADTLLCTPTATDADGTTPTYTYSWSVNGTDPGVMTANLTGAAFAKGDAVTCTVTASDGVTSTSGMTSNRVTIANTAPTLASASISPAAPVVGDTLTCSTVGFSDVDGDADASTFAWTVDGVSAGSGATLSRTLRRGQVVACTVTPRDGTDAGTPVSTSATVANSTPSIASVSISPATAYVASTLTCSASGWSDADGDADQSTFAWTVNGASAGTGASLRGAFVAGDVVVCTGTPNDGATTGAARTATVTIANSAPALASVGLSASTGTPRVGATWTCAPGATTDADGTTSFSYTYTWYLDGSVVSGATTSTFSSASATRGRTVQCEATPSDGATTGSAVRSSALTVENTSPAFATASITPSVARVGDTLTCSASGASDADGDTVSPTYRWLRGSTVLGTGSTLSSGFAGRQTLTCEVTPNDGFAAGTAVTTNLVITNTAPTLAGVSISPSSAYASSTLTCAGTGFADVDGDAEATTFAWTVNGSVVGTGATLSGRFVYGDVVGCTATPYDGATTGTARSTSVTILNSAPIVATASIGPASPTEASTITCSPGTTTDADGTTSFTYSYAWRVNGSLVVGAASSSLTGSSFSHGDTVSCAVAASDGTTTGTATTSTTVTVANTAPSIASVSVSPTTAYAGTTLTCSYTGFSDTDGDTDQSTYAWTINGTSAGTSATLSSGYRRGDVVACAVTPRDASAAGTARSASVTISNTTPSLTGAVITPATARAGDTLSCAGVGFSDADGDTDATTYTWRVNGTSVGTGSTYSGTLRRGDTVACTATPGDGVTTGTAVTSSTLTIENTAPTAPGVSVAPTTATDTENLVCSVATPSTDVDGDTVSYTYAWARNGVAYAAAGTSATLSASYTSPGDIWTCAVTASDGVASSTGTGTAAICTSSTFYVDGDGDGYGRASGSISACSAPAGYASRNGDCSDTNASVYPTAFESCDSLDNDCDGSTDELSADADGDGWRVCDRDCDDADAFANPGYAEICENGVDDDCDGDIDIADVDGDGYLGCGEEDCNDASAAAHPGGTEVDGDLLDNDCDGEVDDSLSDDDDDGYTEAAGDCDDAAPWIHPGATEIPDDEEDQDCDGYEDYAIDFTTTGLGIFVDASVGDDFFPGTQDFPVRTITRGVALAAAGVPVFVAEGTYAEDVTLTHGVSVFGGYDSSWMTLGARSEIDGSTSSPASTTRNDVFARFDVLDTMSFEGAWPGPSGEIIVFDTIIRTTRQYTTWAGRYSNPMLAHTIVHGGDRTSNSVVTLDGENARIWFGNYVVVASTIVGGIARDGADGANGIVSSGTCDWAYCGEISRRWTGNCYQGTRASSGENSESIAIDTPARVMNSIVNIGVSGRGGNGGDGRSAGGSYQCSGCTFPGIGGSGGNGGSSLAYGIGYGPPTADTTGTFEATGTRVVGGHSGIAGNGGDGGNSDGQGGSSTNYARGLPGWGGDGGVSLVVGFGGDDTQVRSSHVVVRTQYGGMAGTGGSRGTGGAATSTGACSGVSSTTWAEIGTPVTNGAAGFRTMYGAYANSIDVTSTTLWVGDRGRVATAVAVGATDTLRVESVAIDATAADVVAGIDCSACSSTTILSSDIAARALSSDAVIGHGSCAVTNALLAAQGTSGSAADLTCSTVSVVNNTMLSTGAAVISLPSGAGAIANNIFVGSGTNTCIIDGLASRSYYRANLFNGCPSRFVYDSAAASYRSTIAAVNFMTATTAYGNNITGDPMFTDAANGDYSISASSPAFNAGYNTSTAALGSVTTDILGNPRPALGGYDIGAYEVQ